MRNLFVALVALTLLAPVASAADLGVQAGVAKDWIRLGEGMDLVELAAPLAGINYDVTLTDEGDKGLSVGYKGSQSAQGDGLSLLVSQYLLEYWGMGFGERLEYFVGGQFETWNRTAALDQTEFLGGARGGIRFDVQGLPFEVAYNYSRGSGGAERHGMFFGARLIS